MSEEEEDRELLPLAGRLNDRGERVLTLEDLPALALYLRSLGWNVVQRKNELICTPGKR